MHHQAITDAAKLLKSARVEHSVLDELPPGLRPRDFDEGYQIQDKLVDLASEPVAGWKIGCTNIEAQKRIGTSEPIAGRLLISQVFRSPARISGRKFFVRIVEAEFSFKLGEDLRATAAPFSAAHVRSAVQHLCPAIEVADSRFRDRTKVGAASLIADNANEGIFVLGDCTKDWNDLDLATHPVVLSANGIMFDRRSGANVLGHPINALTWLANDRAKRGGDLLAGQIITTGTITKVYLAKAGDLVEAEFGALGTVRLEFQS